MIEFIRKFDKDYAIPKGYKHVKWSEVVSGQSVYLVGNNSAFGPLKVVSTENRILLNTTNNRTFYEFPESLLIEE
jgi:hypothetical protein